MALSFLRLIYMLGENKTLEGHSRRNWNTGTLCEDMPGKSLNERI